MTDPVITAPVRPLDNASALRWLALGWQDLVRAPLPSLLHGLVFLAAGAAIAAIGWGRHDLLAGAFSGFLLLAPMLSAGLYEVSRRLARGERPTVADVLAVWVRGGPCMVRLGILLALLGTLWVGLSMLIVSASTGNPGGGVGQFLRGFVLASDPLPFLLWLAAGGVFAALVFAIGAVAVPMLLDREVNMRTAVLTSVRAVGENPAAMGLWAALVMLLTLVGLATVVGLVVLVPLLGHATWHAYSDSVDAASLPPRY
ncbi:DUF2189 domain-containing protein [Quisquiliibacterium transsilvanicum]|jgi:uncharacterized membrane protein|uniref:Putative membrane protein n=1 Tax=Quisquiliibacterium transsilvanicum TaxID=1549638 RepID=A0A7W8HG56_9BURK|nr:DUF2189 domain-containing protein [Quisquiliibacterium transsilvanicum]MBB5271385.1 putative membrane protein [Quisquiliibacterium transsilvanicum]